MCRRYVPLCTCHRKLKMKRSASKPQSNQIYNFFPKKARADVTISDFYSQNLPKIPTEPIREKVIENNNSNDHFKKENEELKLKIKNLEAENEKLKSENKKYVSDLKSLKKMYNNACSLYVKKDAKINLLEKKLLPDHEIYENHIEMLGASAVNQIRKLNGSKRSDSSFVLKIIKKLYEGEIEKLKSKTACGREGKLPMSPSKRAAIDSLFMERLCQQDLKDGEMEVRYSRLNELINFAINNILRKSSTNDIDSKTTSSKTDEPIAVTDPPVNESTSQSSFCPLTSRNGPIIPPTITTPMIQSNVVSLINTREFFEENELEQSTDLHPCQNKENLNIQCVSEPPALHFFTQKQLSFNEF